MDLELKIAVERLHNCKTKWTKSVPVEETFQDKTVWEGIVQVFELQDHPTANRCYAWSYLIDDTSKRKYVAVLHQGPVDSAKNAVKAAIISEYKK